MSIIGRHVSTSNSDLNVHDRSSMDVIFTILVLFRFFEVYG